MVLGCWAGDPLPLSFFCSSFYFLFFSFSSMRARIAWVGVDGFALCPDLFFLRSFLLVSFQSQGCIMSLWLFNVYMDGVMKEVEIGMARRELSGLWERVEIAWPLQCR